MEGEGQMSIAFVFRPRRPAVVFCLALALAGCSPEAMTPRVGVDRSARVNAIVPVDDVDEAPGYPVRDPAVRGSVAREAADNSDFAVAADPRDHVRGGARAAPEKRLPKIDSEWEAMPKIDGVGEVEPQPSVNSQGVNIDAMLGAEPVVGLAEAQNREIAEGNASQPVVDGIGFDNPQEVAEPELIIAPQTGGEVLEPGLMDMMPEDSQSMMRLPGGAPAVGEGLQAETVAFIPRIDDPLARPEALGGMPAAEKSCRQRLKRLGVRFRDIAPIAQGRSCGIEHPVEVSGLSGGIRVKPAAKLNCQMTEAFALWVKNELAPSSRYRYFSGVSTIHQMSSYSCRTMNSKRGNPLSEHAHGNAIDIGKITLKSGKTIDVRKPGFFAFREKGLLKAVRSDSCKYFSTVLGPGSDRHHKDHFHFDLRSRKSGYRHCT